MYDWPEMRGHTDALWRAMASALKAHGMDAPTALTRNLDQEDLWLAPDLLIAETCTGPLATTLAGRVRYVATPVRQAPGCEAGLYRSVIVARKGLGTTCAITSPVRCPDAVIPALRPQRVAVNGSDSLSGWTALQQDMPDLIETVTISGSHRNSVLAVASGSADIAAIDAHAWHLAQRFEPVAVSQLHVIGLTRARPALPLITSRVTSDARIATMRRALATVMDIVIHPDPLAGL